MLKIVHESIKQFKEKVKNKKLIIWGAGTGTKGFLVNCFPEAPIEVILDNDTKWWGKAYMVEGKSYPVTGLDQFLKTVDVESLQRDYILLITPIYMTGKIVHQLNEVREFDGLTCYLGIMLRDYYEPCEFEFTQGEQRIPKKIHYMWVGGTEIPDYLKRYMESWQKFCPDYEIVRWDENNYDVGKIQYMKEAYECKKWGFVPDYARLDIIYQEGGIYLDTDVELVASLDPLLNDEMFCGFTCDYSIVLNGFGAVKGHSLIKELRDYYEGKSFYNADGNMNLESCQFYQNPIFVRNGFSLENSFQKKGNVVIYPSEVLAPIGLSGVCKNFTQKTVFVHRNNMSWKNQQERENYYAFQKELAHLMCLNQKVRMQ